LRDVLHSVFMECVNGMETASLHVICMARMLYLFMEMSWRGVVIILLIGNVVDMCGHNVADVKFWVTVACMEGNSVRD